MDCQETLTREDGQQQTGPDLQGTTGQCFSWLLQHEVRKTSTEALGERRHTIWTNGVEQLQICIGSAP